MSKDTLVVLDNDYEKRYYWSARTAAAGLVDYGVKGTLATPISQALVYRLDVEATAELQANATPMYRDYRNPNPEDANTLIKRLLAVTQRIF